jgi:hypothetical protein
MSYYQRLAPRSSATYVRTPTARAWLAAQSWPTDLTKTGGTLIAVRCGPGSARLAGPKGPRPERDKR